MMRHDVTRQPPLLPRLGSMPNSHSHPMFRVMSSNNSTNMLYENYNFRESGRNPTPNNYNFAVNDQISMFSSQDRRQTMTQKMNTSDIVEYNRDGSTQRPPRSNNADTLERDVSPFNFDHRPHTTRTETNLQNYHSFNPDLPKSEDNDTVAETGNDPKMPFSEDAFSFDKKNLFSIEDLNSKENLPLRELKNQAEEEAQKPSEHKRLPKVKPQDLPRTTFKAQKHKSLLEDTKKFNANSIKADSPVRSVAGSTKSKFLIYLSPI